MDSFLYVTCMNESYSKHIQTTTEQNLKEIEADDLLLKQLKVELEQRYTALEELQQNGTKYDQHEVEKELEMLEKLQCKYNKVEAKRKKLAKQNYEQISKFVDAYETGLSALKSDVNDRSVLSTAREHNDTLTRLNTFQSADFDTSQIDPLFKKRLDNYWKEGSSIYYR
ncbi:unnamed protein product [Rotaria magnacalcarata]|uniref:Uncharacterized protein n=3 Tax=Rotaria magnacalcarata TaxID=392030 RepID=A0A816TE69_9BILA|nr:unnamed protein product [Rotaria magnacalcarata]CAF1664956.1 unnamed protein product [Rotaria magnacalcarata]CAF2096203.1 unnamed protein product [Rotaria magnacalcarata]CAF2100036.1 unnamed protein product [Rotaria magnacalcarata]CAF4092724.1 unnamed protein product [Rotaria magnacalcarata]